MTTRCGWANENNELYCQYHDQQWGVPVHDDTTLFEMLILEGAQAGLSWETILKRREPYRRAFDGFDPRKVADYGEVKVAELLNDAGIIRNRLKVAAAIQNAKVFLQIQQEYGSFDRYLWAFVGGQPVQHHFSSLRELPATDPISDVISKDLKKRGMKFVGSTIIYAYMQAVGLVNDHVVSCFRHQALC